MPDGEIYNLECGQQVIVNLGTPKQMVLMFFYEAQNQDQPGYIDLDWVIIEVGSNAEGPWSLVFNWGNTNASDNGSIHSYHYKNGEMDNEPVPFEELNEKTGILIGVGGSYQYIRISAPPGCSDPAQIDAIRLYP